jgi:hypothetical protein
LIAEVVKGKLFAGLTLGVRTELPVDSRQPDIVVLKKPDDIPILVIETKRKVERRGYFRREERFDPYGRAVIGQALSYAALAKKSTNYRLRRPSRQPTVMQWSSSAQLRIREGILTGMLWRGGIMKKRLTLALTFL